MQDVTVRITDPRALASLIGPERADHLLTRIALPVAARLGDRQVVNVNSTAAGGGVAEMLQVLLGYTCGGGVKARWLVIDGDEQFFALTKRIHNHLYGIPVTAARWARPSTLTTAVMARNAPAVTAVVPPGDIVIVHDPQPLGLVRALHERGAIVVWRCHVGVDHPNDYSERGWAFLRPYLTDPGLPAYVFTRRSFAPSFLPPERVHAIAPSIDPFAPKNVDLGPDQTRAVLGAVGLIAGDSGPVSFRRADGSIGRIQRGCDIIRAGPPPGPDVPLVVQVSRWDRLKDMEGVLTGFADHVGADLGAQLVLVGPVVSSVADDPEGAAILEECWRTWRQLPDSARRRIQLVCIPMTDLEENATVVNALQRHAAVVTQKSLAEGFGLTVSEAMFKSRPVVGGAVGGIVDQVVDGLTGRLLADPTDLASFGTAVADLLGDPERARRYGEAGRQRVVDEFLPRPPPRSLGRPPHRAVTPGREGH